jgi:hypothetical protein
MSELRISLRHADLLETPCSILFIKHIEGSMSAPETALDEAMAGALQALMTEHEHEDHEVLDTKLDGGPRRAYVLNFHTADLPFSYRSVDRYARHLLRVAAAERVAGVDQTVATAVHGPGAGLDASEAMEVMVTAFAHEIQSQPELRIPLEVVFAEKEREVFERLQDRLKYLAAEDLVDFDGSSCIVKPATPNACAVENHRVERLSLRHIFVAMPYDKAFDNTYYFGIKQPIESRGRKCERVDQEAFVGDVVDRIRARIRGSELVIADITENNPNVFFEVGYAEGVGKDVILLSQAQETPFDLKTRRQIRYDPTDIRALAETLHTQLEANLSSTGEAALRAKSAAT